MTDLFPEYFGGNFDTSVEGRGFYLIMRDIGDSHDMLSFNEGLNNNQVLF